MFKEALLLNSGLHEHHIIPACKKLIPTIEQASRVEVRFDYEDNIGRYNRLFSAIIYTAFGNDQC